MTRMNARSKGKEEEGNFTLALFTAADLSAGCKESESKVKYLQSFGCEVK